MAVNTPVTYILDYFASPISEKLVENYYRRKLQQPCFLMIQHGQWTIVTIES
ncbi:MAG: hypothetical protein Q4D16_01065 [Eubacteriales bacterium]|nr:hypothetical protein [Eubacteriales bacterium]